MRYSLRLALWPAAALALPALRSDPQIISHCASLPDGADLAQIRDDHDDAAEEDGSFLVMFVARIRASTTIRCRARHAGAG